MHPVHADKNHRRTPVKTAAITLRPVVEVEVVILAATVASVVQMAKVVHTVPVMVTSQPIP
jgi:hypothetical protein